jgi:hypothetical protein
MPRFLSDADMQSAAIPALRGFAYSAVRTARLGAAEYTLVTIAVDISSSVASFRDLLVDSVAKAIGACARSPRAANILARVVAFGSDVREIHGFKPLAEIDAARDYTTIRVGGNTALFDACASAVGAMADYGEILARQDYGVNGILFVVTDGADNCSTHDAATVRRKVEDVLRTEAMESFTSVLIGINAAQHKAYLAAFQAAAGLTHALDAGDATPGNLARLAAFVSRSVSAVAGGVPPGAGVVPPTGAAGLSF